MTIRVLHLADVLKGGGSEQWIADCIRLASGDIESHAAVLLDRKYRMGFSLGDDLEKSGVPVHHLGPRATRGVLETSGSGSSLSMQHWLRAAYAPAAAAQVVPLLSVLRKHRIDVIHAHMNHSFITGAIASLLVGIPCVYLVPQTREQTSHYAPWMFPTYRLLQSGIRLFFTALSVRELRSQGIPDQKIRFFEAYGELNVRSLGPSENPVVSEFQLERFSPLLLGVGRLVPEKGFLQALQALKRVRQEFPRAGLVILGDGWQRGELESYAAKNGLSDWLILPGFRRDVDLFYPACDIFVRSYLFEGVNRSCAPALRLGKPLVGFRTRSPSEHLVDGESALLTPPGDSEAMAAAILRLLKEEPLRLQIARGSLKVGQSLRTSRDAVGVFEQAYREVVKSR